MRKLPLLALAALTFAFLPGCASHDDPASARAIEDVDSPPYRYDDPQCTPAEQKAIRVAAQAVLGTDTPTDEQTRDLHFAITHRSSNSWFIAVWKYDQGRKPTSFQGVQMDDQYTVQRIVTSGE